MRTPTPDPDRNRIRHRPASGADAEPTEVLPVVAAGASRAGQQYVVPWDGGRRRRWLRIGLGAVVVFALAVLMVTAIEAVRGAPLSGGDRGTTIGRILGDSESP